MGGSRDLSQGGFFSNQHISQRVGRNSLEKQVDRLLHKDLTNCFSRGFIPIFQRKPIATCNFPGKGAHVLHSRSTDELIRIHHESRDGIEKSALRITFFSSGDLPSDDKR